MKELELLKQDKKKVRIQPEVIEDLQNRVEGKVLVSGDRDYEEARKVWNGMIDRRPGVIIQCRSDKDIQEALKFAGELDIIVSVKGGGHHVAGSAVRDGGLMIDLSGMKAIDLDVKNKRVRVEGGATWGEVDSLTQKEGLAIPGGLVSTTGVAGLTLGGGIGWVRRKYGLACDNLLSAEVILPSGEKVTSSETSHPDLFWAIKGGGGGFGVVSNFEFQLHEIGPEVMTCLVFYPATAAEKVLKFYREKAPDMPEEISLLLIYGSVPGQEPFPDNRYGEDFILVAAMYSGAVEEGKSVLQPFRELADPILDLSGPMPYLELQAFFDEDYPKQKLNYYWKSLYFDELSDKAIDKFIELGKNRPSPLTTVDIWQMGGAIDRVGMDATAYPHRGSGHLLGIESNWEKELSDPENIQWTKKAIEDFLPLSGGRSYLNFEGAEDEKALTGGVHQEKLQRIKEKYDKAGLFG
jgi:hypothetical protein